MLEGCCSLGTCWPFRTRSLQAIKQKKDPTWVVDYIATPSIKTKTVSKMMKAPDAQNAACEWISRSSLVGLRHMGYMPEGRGTKSLRPGCPKDERPTRPRDYAHVATKSDSRNNLTSRGSGTLASALLLCRGIFPEPLLATLTKRRDELLLGGCPFDGLQGRRRPRNPRIPVIECTIHAQKCGGSGHGCCRAPRPARASTESVSVPASLAT